MKPLKKSKGKYDILLRLLIIIYNVKPGLLASVFFFFKLFSLHFIAAGLLEYPLHMHSTSTSVKLTAFPVLSDTVRETAIIHTIRFRVARRRSNITITLYRNVLAGQWWFF